MNKYMKSFWLLPLSGLSLSLLPSCTTDSYGNTAVTPGGAAAIGVALWLPELPLGRPSSMTVIRTGTVMTGTIITRRPLLLVPTTDLTGRGNSLFCGMIESSP